jgi:hypothetical protein
VRLRIIIEFDFRGSIPGKYVQIKMLVSRPEQFGTGADMRRDIR